VLSRDYFVSQVASLLKFAKETTNPQLAAVLIEKAADLNLKVMSRVRRRTRLLKRRMQPEK
jgi:hypothetical protein